MNVGRVRVWTTYSQFGAERAGEAAKIVEQLGHSQSGDEFSFSREETRTSQRMSCGGVRDSP